ncbi:hypothetical protein MRB53_016478 [Persea americana]|uniref:Uncharacterized protein n=1 Tax=Persea americana TaxID=3435 RepID=A0ACC2M2G1_PERAE|nr:hypothetical protein MRB53_016478 [Persea americana]
MIAAEVLEAIGSEEEGNVARIHGLEGEAEGGAIEIGVNHQIVDVWCRLKLGLVTLETSFANGKDLDPALINPDQSDTA